MTIDELLAALRDLLAAAEAEGRELNEEEAQRASELNDKIEAAKARADVQKRSADLLAPRGVSLPNHTFNTGAQKSELERAFEAYLRGDRGAENELRAQNTGTDSAGGFIVPQSFRDKLVERQKAYGGFASVVESFTTGDGRAIEWPTLDDTANSGVITSEGSQQGSGGADLVFGTGTLGAYKYTSTGASNEPLRISVELLQDAAFDVQALAARKLGERIARKQALDIVTGTGSSMPKGILNGTPDLELTGSNAITYDVLMGVVEALDEAYEPGAKWLMNRATWFDIMRIVDGQDRPLNLGYNVSGFNPQDKTLFGFPVVIDQAAPSVADDVNFLAFGDFKEAYVQRHVKDVVIAVDPYTRAKYGQVEVTAWARMDGTVQNRNAYVLLKGKDAA